MNYHPAITAAMDAVHDACRKGMMGDGGRAAVRVEISYGVENELRMRMHRDFDFGARHAPAFGCPGKKHLGILAFAVGDDGYRVLSCHDGHP